MFFTRFMSSVVLVVLSLFTIFAGGYFLGVVLLFLALTAYRELSKAWGATSAGFTAWNSSTKTR